MKGKTTITVAWTDGAYGDAIAREVARQLGFRFLNDEIVERAAQHAGVDTREMESLEHRETLVARILRSLASVQVVDPSTYTGYIADETPAYRDVIKEVVRAAAVEGSAVIGLHGAAVTLAGRPGLLRVFVTAPRETRIERVAAEQGVSPKAAQAAVEKTDSDRRDYFRKFFNIDEERPTLYDLAINTGVLSTDEAVRAILAIAREA